MQWIFSPLMPLVLFVLAIVLQLALFLAIKREQAQMRAAQDMLERKCVELHALHEALIGRLAGEVEELKERQTGATRAAGFSMNLTRRQQVIQMARKGASPASIASTLHLPAREVELLLKVLKGLPPPV